MEDENYMDTCLNCVHCVNITWNIFNQAYFFCLANGDERTSMKICEYMEGCDDDGDGRVFVARGT